MHRLMKMAGIALLVLLAFALAPSAMAQEGFPTRPDGSIIIKSSTFELRPTWTGMSWENVAGAELYYVRTPGADPILSLTKLSPPGAAGEPPAFRLTLRDDGFYGFYFVLPNQLRPRPGDTPNKTIYIDRTAPSIQTIAPQQGSSFRTGKTVRIEYNSLDENPNTATGTTIEYSRDNGATWTNLVKNGPVTGHFDWKPDFEDVQMVWIRIAIADVVGNVGHTVIEGFVVGAHDELSISDRPAIAITGPRNGKIFFEHTDFYYSILNNTGSPTAMVVIYYSMDDGMTWQVGGTDYAPGNQGKIDVYFKDGFRRNGAFGNYNSISFYYQVVTQDRRSNLEDPVNGVSVGLDRYNVDTQAPLLHLASPSFGDKLYRGRIPHNEDSGKYSIQWGGIDHNAVPFVEEPGHERGPVSVFYTSDPDNTEATWILLADRLPLNFTFVKFNDLPLGRVRVKVRAMDQMGNESVRMSSIFEVFDGTSYQSVERGIGDRVDADRLWGEANQFAADGKYQDALMRFDRAIELAARDKKDSIEHDKAVALYAAGRAEEATESMLRVVANQPDNVTFRYTLANLYFKRGMRGDAKSQLVRIVERDDAEPHIAARSMLATIEKGDGNTEAARTLWKYIVEHGSPASDEYKNAKQHLGMLAK